MKKFICVLLSIITVLSFTAVPTFAIQEDVKAAYTNELEWLKISNGYDPNDMWGYQIEYCVYDINKDGIKELIVKMGTCEADYIYRFYSCEYGKIISLGTCDAGDSALYECDINGIFIHRGHMGVETLTRVSKNGHSLTSTQIFEYDLNQLIMKGIDADYHYPERYIEMYNANDYSGLY